MPAGSLPTQAPGGRFTCNGIALSGQARNVPAHRIEDWGATTDSAHPCVRCHKGALCGIR